jgi:GNAT superfamily N-acetyltransferase
VSAELASFSFECQPLSAAHARVLPELFERAASGCYCEWWHFEGDKNAWLERLAHHPEANRRRLVERAETPGLSGVVAVSELGDAVGWMKLTLSSEVPKLYAQRPYRGLPCFQGDRERTATIGCFLVEPAWRKRDVAKALLRAGIELARAAGAVAIEAFPRRAEGLRDEEVWTGPHELYVKHGFDIVHDLAQYPVLRRML